VREKKSQTLMRVCVRAHKRLYFFKFINYNIEEEEEELQ